MKLLSVVDSRPNFMKMTPFIKAISTHNQIEENKIEHVLVHKR